MSEEPIFKVYVKPGCPWCTQAIAYLDKEGYEYESIDVISNPDKFAEMEEISGQRYAPTLTYGDLLLADFGVDELIPFLEKNGLAR